MKTSSIPCSFQRSETQQRFARKLLNLTFCITTFVLTPIDFLPASWPRHYELFSFFSAKIPERDWESFLFDWYPPFRKMYEISKRRGSPITMHQLPNVCKRIITPIVIFQTYDYDCLFNVHIQWQKGRSVSFYSKTLFYSLTAKTQVVKQAGTKDRQWRITFIQELGLQMPLYMHILPSNWACFYCTITVDSPSPGGPVIKFGTSDWNIATEHGAIKQVHPQFLCSY